MKIKKVIFKDGKWYLNEVEDEHEISRPKIENKEIKYEFMQSASQSAQNHLDR